jgi:WhiB family redox-sensing transcriptional regulator
MSPGSGEQLPSLEELYRRPDWMELAACAGQPIEVFFPAKGHSAAAAKAVCAVCSVRTECYDYAQSFTDTPAGVWGGESERSRKRFAGVPCSCPVGQVEPCQSTVILARAVQRQWRWRDSNPRPPEFQ